MRLSALAAQEPIKLGDTRRDAAAVGVSVPGELELGEHVPAQVASGLRGERGAAAPLAEKPVELERMGREAIERVGVVFQISGRRAERSADVDRVLGDTGNKREIELSQCAGDLGPRLPAAKEA